ncbi:MAG: hypothetical protein ABJ327_22385 [Litoreibacter sp.]
MFDETSAERLTVMVSGPASRACEMAAHLTQGGKFSMPYHTNGLHQKIPAQRPSISDPDRVFTLTLATGGNAVLKDLSYKWINARFAPPLHQGGYNQLQAIRTLRSKEEDQVIEWVEVKFVHDNYGEAVHPFAEINWLGCDKELEIASR